MLGLNISTILIISLLYLVIQELIRYRQLNCTNNIRYKFLTKPLYDKYITDDNTNDIIKQNDKYKDMFNGSSPWNPT